MVDRNIFKYTFGIGLVAGVILAAILLIPKDKDKVPGPEEVVNAFTMAVATGDFETAASLCDTCSMKDYIDSCQDTWNRLSQEDSSALSIAAAILSEMEFKVEDIDKEKERTSVTYTLEGHGNKKTKTAFVKKEEGEWKVTGLTDKE